MISDVLAESADEIRRYLKEMPHVYEEDFDSISSLLKQMDALRVKLDMPPDITKQ